MVVFEDQGHSCSLIGRLNGYSSIEEKTITLKVTLFLGKEWSASRSGCQVHAA